MKKGDTSSPLLFNFALEYAIRKVKETNLGLNMSGIHQVFTIRYSIPHSQGQLCLLEASRTTVLVSVNFTA